MFVENWCDASFHTTAKHRRIKIPLLRPPRAPLPPSYLNTLFGREKRNPVACHPPRVLRDITSEGACTPRTQLIDRKGILFRRPGPCTRQLAQSVLESYHCSASAAFPPKCRGWEKSTFLPPDSFEVDGRLLLDRCACPWGVITLRREIATFQSHALAKGTNAPNTVLCMAMESGTDPDLI